MVDLHLESRFCISIWVVILTHFENRVITCIVCLGGPIYKGKNDDLPLHAWWYQHPGAESTRKEHYISSWWSLESRKGGGRYHVVSPQTASSSSWGPLPRQVKHQRLFTQLSVLQQSCFTSEIGKAPVDVSNNSQVRETRRTNCLKMKILLFSRWHVAI